MNPRKAGLVFILLVLTFSVSAQTSFSELVGAEASTGESLVNFVNNFTTFDLSTPGEVFLYVLAPLAGFYFLISNFAQEGYNHFQQRLDQRDYYSPDEELPTGIKLFSLVTAFITVMTVGMIAPGFILILGGLALLLGVLMFAGLFNPGEGNEGNGGQNGGNNGGAGNGSGNGSGNGNNGQQNNGNQVSLADTLDSAANLIGSARGVAQNVQQQNQQQNLSRLQESLRYFDNDMIDDIEYVDSNIGSIRTIIEDAENEFNSGSFDKNSFQPIVKRIGKLNGTLYQYNKKIEEDMTGPGSRNWSDPNCELKKYHNSVSPSIHEQAELIVNQLESVLKDERVPPPDDSIRKLMDSHLDYLVAVGHFVATVPYNLGNIATDRKNAEEVYHTAKNMGRIEDRPNRDEVQQLMQLCSALENKSDPKNLIKEAEALCEKELKVEKGEIEFFKKFLEKDGELLEQAKKVEDQLQYYSGLPGSVQGQITNLKTLIDQAMNKASRMESAVKTHGQYESEAYQVLRKFDSKI